MRIRKEKELIPLEKSKKVIKIEPRNGREKKHYLGVILLSILAVFCFVYCISIGLMMTGSSFFLVWGLLGVFFAGWAFLLAKPRLLRRIPRPLKIVVGILAAVGTLFILIIGTVIYTSAKDEAAVGADYVIVLGAQWKESGPSAVLRYRLDTALEYLEENPDTKVIVTGCKGANEPISEAEGMAGYFMNAGIAQERIFMEDQAANTYQNMLYSSEFCDKAQDQVIVVTNDFHVFRAVALGRAMGYEQLEGLAAPSHKTMLPQNLLRECLALVKEVLAGNV